MRGVPASLARSLEARQAMPYLRRRPPHPQGRRRFGLLLSIASFKRALVIARERRVLEEIRLDL